MQPTTEKPWYEKAYGYIGQAQGALGGWFGLDGVNQTPTQAHQAQFPEQSRPIDPNANGQDMATTGQGVSTQTMLIIGGAVLALVLVIKK